VRANVASVLAVAIAALLTAGAPIAMRKASLLATEEAVGSRMIPGAAAGIDVVITSRSQAGGQVRIPPPVAPAPSAEIPVRRGADDAPFGIVLPLGWSGGEVEDFEDDAERSFRYQDEVGRYFVVNLDPMGSDFSADEVWEYGVAGDRFLVENERRCVPGEAGCSVGDGERTIFAIWQEGGSAPVGAHTWYFRFGDSSSEIGGTRVFREILESIRVTV